MFKAGFSIRNITPQTPAWLSGYAARNRKSCGIHDNLYVKTFYVTDGETECAFISCDVVCLLHEQVENIRYKSLKLCNVRNITVGATHTHSGPTTCQQLAWLPGQTVDKEWLEFLENMAAETVAEAKKKAVNAEITAGICRAPEVTKNRRKGETVVDDELMVLKVNNLNGNTIGFLINYACHCTILDGNNYLITADFPYYLYKKLADKYPGAEVLYFNGAAGDLNIGYSADDSALGKDMGSVRTFKNAEHKSDILINHIERCLKDGRNLNPKIIYKTLSLKLPVKDGLPTAPELEQKVVELDKHIDATGDDKEKTQLQVLRVYAKALEENVVGYHTENSSYIPAESVLAAIDDILIITIPGELFCEIGMRIKKTFKDQWKPEIFGYTNGYYGYMATKRANEIGGYEIETSVHNKYLEDYLDEVMKTEKENFHNGSRISKKILAKDNILKNR